MPLPRTMIVQPEWITAQVPAQWLNAEERAVWASWHSVKRQADWLAGRLAAKRLLRDELGIEPLDWQAGREGAAPAIRGCDLPGIVLSISHSHGRGAATISDLPSEGSAGIDIQCIRPVHPGLCTRVFAPEERRQIAEQFGSENNLEGMLLFWALKEAAIKARRLPWGRSLSSIGVRLTVPGSSTVGIEGEPLVAAQYERLGEWWIARAVKPLGEAVFRMETERHKPIAGRSSSGAEHQ